MRSWERNAALLRDRYPKAIALAQAGWERRRQVVRAHALGVTYRQMAASDGRHTARMHQLGVKGWREYDAGRQSPAEFYDHIMTRSAICDVGRLIQEYLRHDAWIRRLEWERSRHAR